MNACSPHFVATALVSVAMLCGSTALADATLSAHPSPSPAFQNTCPPQSGTPGDQPPTTAAQKDEAWRNYTANAAEALGAFDDIPIFERIGETWRPVSTGKFLPITVNGHAPERYEAFMRSDRPMMLPTAYTGATLPQGQSVPYAVVGRMPGGNPEVQWVYLARHYQIRKPTDDNFDTVSDIAVIGHHPRTGATAFFQYYRPDKPIEVPTIPSPFGAGGPAFWQDVPWISWIDCGQCHSADPFIRSPYVSQPKFDPRPGQLVGDPIVPSNPLGPFWYIDATMTTEAGAVSLFAHWEKNLFHLKDDASACTSCHRIGNADALGLYPNSTRGVGLDNFKPDPCQTDMFQKLPWMPYVSEAAGDFYAGQTADMQQYVETWGPSVAETVSRAAQANRLTAAAPGPSEALGQALADLGFAPTPAPPADRRSIMVEREHRDVIAAGKAVVLVDTRMSANTDGKLRDWRFVAGPAADGMQATPAVLRATPSASDEVLFSVVAVGATRGVESAGDWVAVSNDDTVALARGDYLGLVLSNASVASGEGLVPYSDDDWAVVRDSSGATAYPVGIVTYRIDADEVPRQGAVLSGKSPAYRTYSFEFRR